MDFTQNFSALMGDDKWFYLTSLMAFSLFFVCWIAYARYQSSKKLKQLRSEIHKLERQFDAVRNRSLSNLQIVRNVMDGFDGILKNMRQSLDEEEKKLQAIEVKKEFLQEEKLTIQKSDEA